MPTYEYQCQKCKKMHEAFQSITAKPLARCPRPKCGGKLKRLMSSGSGFLFKGSGFYITDNRSKSYQEAKKKDQPASSSASSPSSSEKPSKSSNASAGPAKSGAGS